MEDDSDRLEDLFGRKEIAPTEHLSAKMLCERCGISPSRFRYLKDLGLVSKALGAGANAHYTEKHVLEAKAARRRALEKGSFAGIRGAALPVQLPSEGTASSSEVFTYETERVYSLWTGIRVVVPADLSEKGSEQLNRILLAAQDPTAGAHDRAFGRALHRLDRSARVKTRPKTKVKREPPSPLPSV